MRFSPGARHRPVNRGGAGHQVSDSPGRTIPMGLAVGMRVTRASGRVASFHNQRDRHEKQEEQRRDANDEWIV